MGYLYEMDPHNPLPISVIQSRWVGDGGKQGTLPDEEIHGWYTVNELEPYREYAWSEQQHRETDEEWRSLVESIQSSGFDVRRPVILLVGRNGVTKVGEGNHRIGAAKQAGYREKIPVRFLFYQHVSITPMPPMERQANPDPADPMELARMLMDELRQGEPAHRLAYMSTSEGFNAVWKLIERAFIARGIIQPRQFKVRDLVIWSQKGPPPRHKGEEYQQKDMGKRPWQVVIVKPNWGRPGAEWLYTVEDDSFKRNRVWDVAENHLRLKGTRAKHE